MYERGQECHVILFENWSWRLGAVIKPLLWIPTSPVAVPCLCWASALGSTFLLMLTLGGQQIIGSLPPILERTEFLAPAFSLAHPVCFWNEVAPGDPHPPPSSCLCPSLRPSILSHSYYPFLKLLQLPPLSPSSTFHLFFPPLSPSLLLNLSHHLFYHCLPLK